MGKRRHSPRSGVLFLAVLFTSSISLCLARSPTPCEVQREDEVGQHIICSSITNFNTIISYLDQVNSAPADLFIVNSPELVLTREGFQNPAFSNLVQLGLVKNGITEFNPEVLTGLPKLNKLHLFLNNITNLDENSFAGLNLTVLVLKENQITSIAIGTFRNLPHLQDLDLSDNNLAVLPATIFQGLTDLDNLHLTGNHLTSLDENLFQGLEYLNILNLSGNKITSLGPNVLQPLTRITELQLSYNLLESIGIKQFESNSKLVTLDLSNNNLSNLSTFYFNISSLQEIIIQNNNISEIPSGYFELMPNLVIINLGNNQLKSFQTSEFADLKNLRYLHLGGNNLISVIVDGFRTDEWKEGDSPRYAVITSSHGFDCAASYVVDARKWFNERNYNFDKIFACPDEVDNNVVGETAGGGQRWWQH